MDDSHFSSWFRYFTARIVVRLGWNRLKARFKRI